METVLVVDDTPELRSTMRRILVSAGYEVLCAPNGPAGLEIAALHPIAAALVDYQMPEMDGLEVLARLREIRPGTVRLLISGALDVDVVMTAVNNGDVSGVLRKPFGSDDLIQALRKALRRRATSSQGWLRSQDERERDDLKALRGLLNEGMDLGLQPVVDSRTQRAVGFEALLRTTHRDLSDPHLVLAAAERHDLVSEVTRRVVELASEWMLLLPADMQLYLNIHPDELINPGELVARLEPLRPAADRVVLEITERRALPEADSLGRCIAELRATGFRIALDDLGAGASSLAALSQVDPDVVKIDMSLIRDIDKEPRKQRLVEVLCRFASASHIKVVAEGIESEGEANVTAALGVDYQQGYFFGRAQTTAAQVLADAAAPALPIGRAVVSKQSGTRQRLVRRTRSLPGRRRRRA